MGDSPRTTVELSGRAQAFFETADPGLLLFHLCSWFSAASMAWPLGCGSRASLLTFGVTVLQGEFDKSTGVQRVLGQDRLDLLQWYVMRFNLDME